MIIYSKQQESNWMKRALQFFPEGRAATPGWAVRWLLAGPRILHHGGKGLCQPRTEKDRQALFDARQLWVAGGVGHWDWLLQAGCLVGSAGVTWNRLCRCMPAHGAPQPHAAQHARLTEAGSSQRASKTQHAPLRGCRRPGEESELHPRWEELGGRCRPRG